MLSAGDQMGYWEPRVLPPATSSHSSHLHHHRTNMDLRKFVSKPFKKLKHRLAERSRKRGGGSGSESDRDRREANIEGTEASQRSSRLHSEVEVAESQAPAQPLDGPNRERDSNDVKGKKVDRVDSPISPPPILPDGGSESK